MKEMLDRVRGETGLLLFFLVVSTYMYIEARTFPEDAAQFPKLTAGVVIVGSALLLARPYLPEFMDTVLSDEAELMTSTETEDLIEGDEDQDSTSASNATDTATGGTPDDGTVDRRYPMIPSTVFTTVVISVYVLCGYLFGLLWATPVFVAFYMWWYKLNWWHIMVTTAVSTAVVYLFIVFLYAPFDSGVLFDPSGVLELS